MARKIDINCFRPMQNYCHVNNKITSLVLVQQEINKQKRGKHAAITHSWLLVFNSFISLIEDKNTCLYVAKANNFLYTAGGEKQNFSWYSLHTAIKWSSPHDLTCYRVPLLSQQAFPYLCYLQLELKTEKDKTDV